MLTSCSFRLVAVEDMDRASFSSTKSLFTIILKWGRDNDAGTSEGKFGNRFLARRVFTGQLLRCYLPSFANVNMVQDIDVLQVYNATILWFLFYFFA